MAEYKITDLAADTAPTEDDLVETVNDAGGTPASKKVTIANLSKAILLDNIPDDTNYHLVSTAQQTVINNTSGTNTGDEPAADLTTPGIVEIATAAETTTGTDATRAVSPDGLAGSIHGTKTVCIKVIADDTALTTGDGKIYWTVPIEVSGMDLVSVGAHVYTVSSSGTPTVMIHNLTDVVDMLSTAITIDANEKDSSTAATPAVINAATDDVVEGDEIRIDVDVAGTGTAGLEVRLGFRTP